MSIERGPSVGPDAHADHLLGGDFDTHALAMQQMLDPDKPISDIEIPAQLDLGDLEDYKPMEEIEPLQSKAITGERRWSDGQHPDHENDIAWDY